MLLAVSLPVAEIAEMKPAHVKLLAVLLSFADLQGRCWPALRTIADRARQPLSWVQRNIAEMAEAGYLATKRRRGASHRYLIAERFLPRWARAKNPQPSAAETAPHREDSTVSSTGPARQADQARAAPNRSPASGTREAGNPAAAFSDSSPGFPTPRSPASGTKEIPGSGLHLESIRGVPGLRRFAPPLDRTDASPEAKAARRGKWLDRLSVWVARGFKGNIEAQMGAWELLAEARDPTRLPKHRQRELDRLDGLMRASPWLAQPVGA